jgi:excisionase family DNA binding protein
MRTQDPPDVLLGAGEVARRLNVTRQTVYRLTREGELPAIKLGTSAGSTLRYDPDEIAQWLADHRTTAA